MRKEMLIMGLVGLLGCDYRDVSRVGENINLTKPEGCNIVKDIKYEFGNSGISGYYQLLCSDSEGNLTLYHRKESSTAWLKINTK